MVLAHCSKHLKMGKNNFVDQTPSTNLCELDPDEFPVHSSGNNPFTIRYALESWQVASCMINRRPSQPQTYRRRKTKSWKTCRVPVRRAVCCCGCRWWRCCVNEWCRQHEPPRPMCWSSTWDSSDRQHQRTPCTVGRSSWEIPAAPVMSPPCSTIQNSYSAPAASAVYATANPSVRLYVCLSVRHTPVLCLNEATQSQRDAVFTIG